MKLGLALLFVLWLTVLVVAQEPGLRLAVVGGGSFASAAAQARRLQSIADANVLQPDLVVVLAPWSGGQADAGDVWHRLEVPWLPPADAPLPADTPFVLVQQGAHGRAVRWERWLVVVLAGVPGPDARAWLSTVLADREAVGAVVVQPLPIARDQTGDWQACLADLEASRCVRAVVVGGAVAAQQVLAHPVAPCFAVPSLGTELAIDAPAAGFLHGVHVLTLRSGRATMATVPLGVVQDLGSVDAALVEDALAVVHGLSVELVVAEPLDGDEAVSMDGRVATDVRLRCRNPSGRAIDVELTPEPTDGWWFGPDHEHLVVPPRGEATTRFVVRHEPSAPLPFALPQLVARCDLRLPGRTVPLPPRAFLLPLPPPEALGREPAAGEGALVLDGTDACLRVPPARPAPASASSIEAWVRCDAVRGRQVVLAEGPGPHFLLAIDGGRWVAEVDTARGRVVAATARAAVVRGSWTHVAAVLDDDRLRLFVDGAPVAETAAPAVVRGDGSLVVGARLALEGPVEALFGCVDDVRVSRSSRYTAAFAPAKRHAPDADTLVLLPCDVDFGPWTADRSGSGRHARRLGAAYCTLLER